MNWATQEEREWGEDPLQIPLPESPYFYYLYKSFGFEDTKGQTSKYTDENKLDSAINNGQNQAAKWRRI